MKSKFSIALFAALLVVCSCFAHAQTNNARMLSGVNYQTGTSYSLQPADSTRVVSLSNASPVAVCLSSPQSLCSGVIASSGVYFGAGYEYTLVNKGVGTVTVTCSGCTVNGAATLALTQGLGADIYGDGANFTALVTSSAGGGFSNPMTTLGDLIVGGSSGTPGRLAGPTGPNNVPQQLMSTPSGGVATTQFWAPSGVPTNAQIGTTYTVLATDRGSYVTFSNAGAIAVTLPQAGTTGFANNFVFAACDIGSGTATITPTTSTISYSDGAAYTSGASSMTLSTGQCASIYSDNTNYFAAKRVGSSGAAFSTLAGGTNNAASMLVGTGASMGTSGTGSIQATGLPRSTVASLPTTLPTGTVYQVIDGSFQGDCALGGGAFPALCAWNGSIWQATGDGGGVTSNPGTINLAISYNMSCATINGTGASTTTNGTVTSGSTSILLTSATGFAPGQGVFIVGAGAASGPYNGIILTVVSNTITVNVATGTTVTGAQVFNYASPVQTTTSGTVGTGTSVPVVSAATFEAGQGIYIAGAGAAAANYVGKVQSVNFGTNTITVTPATSTSVTNAVVQHDETSALNSAIGDLAAGVTNGMLMPPAGICLFNGPLLRTGDANAIIPLPNVPYNTNGTFTSPNGPTLGITIAGATTPAWSNYNLNGWTTIPTFSGTVFQTSVASGNFIGAQNPNETDKFTAVHLTVRDLTFRTVDNPGITMLNAAFVIGLSAERLLFDTLANGAQGFPSQPTHSNGQGLITPTSDNDAQNYVRDVRVQGFFTAMTWGEHLNIDHAILYANWQGLACNIPNNVHRSIGQYIDIENTAYGIVANGGQKCWLDIVSFDTELNQVPAWVSGATNQAQIYDPNNLLTGNVRVTFKTYYNSFGAKNLNISFNDGQQITGAALAFVPGIVGFANLTGGGAALQPDKNSNALCNRQAMEVTMSTSPTAGTTSGCVGQPINLSGFNFTGQTVTLRVPRVLTPNANLYSVFELGIDHANQLAIYVNNSTFAFAKEVAGAQTIIASTTYNPSVMLWWRMAESSGAVTASYSPDGINWTTLGTCAATCVSWAYTSSLIGIQVVDAGSAGPTNPGFMVADNWTLTTNTPNYPRNIVTDGLFGSSTYKEASACETAFATTTLATGATTTDTGLNCLPANAVIDAVVYRITTTITTAASFTIGDATTAARFCGTQSTLTAGTTGVCMVPWTSATAGTMGQVSAAKVRVTTNVNPGAGAIRLIVYYHTFTPPTS